MSYLPQLLTLVGVWVIALISPGPDFIVTIRYSIAHSRRDGVFVALGIATGTSIWVTTGIVGLGMLLAQLSWLVAVIRLVGALYLTYLGIKAILNAHRPMQKTLIVESSSSRRISSWRVGFLTNISNPKALAFFASIFVALLPAHPPFWFQVTIIMIMVVTVAIWFCIVACLFSLGPIATMYRRAKKWLDYLAGGLFVALGVRLALSR
jgi:RhtB (resistance to homoserine/threonine) family protein